MTCRKSEPGTPSDELLRHPGTLCVESNYVKQTPTFQEKLNVGLYFLHIIRLAYIYRRMSSI